MQAARLVLLAIALLTLPALAPTAAARLPCLVFEDGDVTDDRARVAVCVLAVAHTEEGGNTNVSRRPAYVGWDLAAHGAAWRGAAGWEATQQGPTSDETRASRTWIGSRQDLAFDNGLVHAHSAHDAMFAQEGRHGPVAGTGDRDYRNATAADAAAQADAGGAHGQVPSTGLGSENHAQYESTERQHAGGGSSRSCGVSVNGEDLGCPTTAVRVPHLIFLTP